MLKKLKSSNAKQFLLLVVCDEYWNFDFLDVTWFLYKWSSWINGPISQYCYQTWLPLWSIRPLIDLQGLHGPSHSHIIQNISQACQSYGFFQVCKLDDLLHHDEQRRCCRIQHEDERISVEIGGGNFWKLRWEGSWEAWTAHGNELLPSVSRARAETSSPYSFKMTYLACRSLTIPTFYCPSPDAVIGTEDFPNKLASTCSRLNMLLNQNLCLWLPE